jgi:signal transduction histidine kinase
MNDHAIEIRQRAEKKLAAQAIAAPPARPEEAEQILHELRVHQIELEMQNEELRLAQQELDASRARYFNLYDHAPVGYFILSGKGQIEVPNLAFATLLRVVRIRPGANPPPVKLDPSQVDQILTNLFINARDAIGGVGKITVATSSTTLDRAFCDDHPGASPGEYVLLRVSDTGCGMTKDVLANLFEPFFTTKDIGKETGLGLATVHGIVMQNHGFIDVSSEPDKGTTFRIYLPVYSEEIDKTSVASSGEVPRGRGETILFVDDDRRKGGAGRKDALPPEAEQSRRHGPQGARGAG